MDDTDLGEGKLKKRKTHIFLESNENQNIYQHFLLIISDGDDDSSRKSDRSEDSDFEIDDIYIKKQLIFGDKWVTN